MTAAIPCSCHIEKNNKQRIALNSELSLRCISQCRLISIADKCHGNTVLGIIFLFFLHFLLDFTMVYFLRGHKKKNNEIRKEKHKKEKEVGKERYGKEKEKA